MIDVLFISKALNNMLPPVFKYWFQFYYNIHHCSTTSSMKGHLHKKSFRMNNFREFSVTVRGIDSWNKMQGQMGEIASKNLRTSKTEWLLTDIFFNCYLAAPRPTLGHSQGNSLTNPKSPTAT